MKSSFKAKRKTGQGIFDHELIVLSVGRSFSSSPLGKFLPKEKELDVC